jgi:hypothetical protein
MTDTDHSMLPDPGWRQLVTHLRNRPGMWCPTRSADYWPCVLGYLLGYDLHDSSGVMDEVIERIAQRSTHPAVAFSAHIEANVLGVGVHERPDQLDEDTQLRCI